MTTLEIVLIGVIWAALGLFMYYKTEWIQGRNDSVVILTMFIIIAPLWFIGAIIRQVFIEKWK